MDIQNLFSKITLKDVWLKTLILPAFPDSPFLIFPCLFLGFNYFCVFYPLADTKKDCSRNPIKSRDLLSKVNELKGNRKFDSEATFSTMRLLFVLPQKNMESQVSIGLF